MSVIEVVDLSVTIGGRTVLDRVTMQVGAGEILTIVGPNGSGKTTLLRAMIGAQSTKAGHVQRKAGLRLGYVPQRLAIDPTFPMTVARFLDLPHRHPQKAKDATMARVGIAHLPDRQISALSGGQLQRVMLARAIIGTPHVLLLDEPTQGLDQPGTADFYALIAELRGELGCAVVMVSHDLHVVMSASDRVICLNTHLCCQGTPAIVASAPEYRALFGHGTRGVLALYRHEHDHAHDAFPVGSAMPGPGGSPISHDRASTSGPKEAVD
ncbi:MAG: metal ABC transporter ATP-binding protein [Pseudomonadota bacterium]